MKIQCDVCSKEEASVFCSADEAALCGGCDRRVHHANKIAGNHPRFSLQRLSIELESPPCDICQEKRAILFCQEDRAMLCSECDIPIHKANKLTEKHNRFLLTSVRLSPSSSSSSSSYVGDFATDSQIKSSVSNKLSKPSSYHKGASPSTSWDCGADMDGCPSKESSESNTSSISEYLIETLPGWCVDDFLDPSCSPTGLCKFLDHDLESVLYPFTLEDKSIWVPQAPIQSSHIPLGLTQTGALNVQLKGVEKAEEAWKFGRKWNEYGFAVPQICPPVKKSRNVL